MKDYFVLFTHSCAESGGGGLVRYDYQLIGCFDSYEEAFEKAKVIGCNPNHCGYEFSIFKMILAGGSDAQE